MATAQATSTSNQKRVAFFAGMSTHYGPVLQNRDLIMNGLVTNVGSAYNTKTGRFTAPVRAIYQFNVTIAAQMGHKAAVRLMKNGIWVVTIRADSATNQALASASNVAILSLEGGDEISLQLISEASHVHGSMFTTFSGHLIF